MKLIIFGAFIAVLASVFINFVDAEELFCDIAFLTTGQIIVKHGFPFEKHFVTTEDGYDLEMHRIPKVGGTPICFGHDLLGGSHAFILTGPGKALAYLLHASGYDIWLGNFRGNRYSRTQAPLIPLNRYWDFSFHELGKYDLPAMIDYILAKTSKDKLHYIGHSQGSTSFLTMASLRPEYNDKIMSAQLLSSVAFMEHATSPFIIALSLVADFSALFLAVGHKEILASSPLMTFFGQLSCVPVYPISTLCQNFFWLLFGYGSTQVTHEMLQCIAGQDPAGASSKALLHYGQLCINKNFATFAKTIFSSTQSYPLNKVIANVFLYYSKNDAFNHELDVLRLEEALPNVIDTYLVPIEGFNHIDFIYGDHNSEAGGLYTIIRDNINLM